MKSAENPPSDLVPIDELDQAIVDLSARINASTYELLVFAVTSVVAPRTRRFEWRGH